MDSIKDLQEVLSDFGSCQSTLDNSSSSDEATENLKNGTNVNTSISKKKRKNKARSEYSREEFLKKQNTQLSPSS